VGRSPTNPTNSRRYQPPRRPKHAPQANRYKEERDKFPTGIAPPTNNIIFGICQYESDENGEQYDALDSKLPLGLASKVRFCGEDGGGEDGEGDEDVEPKIHRMK